MSTLPHPVRRAMLRRACHAASQRLTARAILQTLSTQGETEARL